MVTITPAEAVTLVRKNLDELDPNGSAMYDPSASVGDNASLDDTIKRMLPDAINAIHLAAPIQLLEGKDVTPISPAVGLQGDLYFLLPASTKYLRLVAFRAADSSIVVTDPLPEASPEGRKQLNKYVRGRYDRPRLVLLQGRHTSPAFKYYSINTEGTRFQSYRSAPATAISWLSIIEEQFYSATALRYEISRRLRQNIIDYLTALVMDIYSDQRAQSFYQKASSFAII